MISRQSYITTTEDIGFGAERMDEAMKNNRIRFTSVVLQKIQYLDEMAGDIVDDMWSDIYPISSALEAEGYPTQRQKRYSNVFLELLQMRAI